jgi:hypothetical protein
MPKCLECGFEAPRLQWTHFKYKCTGKFNNGQEYMTAHPGAKTVDAELAQRTAVTLESFVRKYGEEEGARRFDSYRQKQADSNKLEYKKHKHGWTEEQYREYNLSRAITPETMIKKYGLEDGIRRYEDYCNKQKFTKSREYVVTTYGEAKWEEINRLKTIPHNPVMLAERDNITIDQAVSKIAARHTCAYVSDLELEFVTELEKLVGKLDHTNKHSPYGKWDHENNRYVVYDVKHGSCVIEFNGDYWHANPAIYDAQDHIRGKSAQDIWSKDQIKLDIARKAGLNVKVVWEHDYRSNKDQVLKELAEWIQNTHK